MTTFLARLVDRARGTASRVEPIIPSLYAWSTAPVEAVESESLRTPRDGATNAAKTPPEPQAKAQPGPELLGPDGSPEIEGRPDIASSPEIVDERFRPKRTMELPKISNDGTMQERHVAPPAAPRAQRGVRKTPLPAHPAQLMPRDPSPSNEPPAEAPVVRITIGRIDVRTAGTPASAARPAPRRTNPALSLDAYLKTRKDGTP